MLPKKNRLPLRTELRRVKKEGQLIRANLFSFLMLDSKKEKDSRFGFIISKKVAKKAVVRNRYRRLLSEAVGSRLADISPGVDGVFLVKKSIVGKKFEEIKKEVETVFRKIEIRNKI